MSQPDDKDGKDKGAAQARQIEHALRQVQRSMVLLEPVRPRVRAHYQRLRVLRDRLEEGFTLVQIERLHRASIDFSKDVAELERVVNDLAAATQRSAKVHEIVGYIATAVELSAQLVARILALI